MTSHSVATTRDTLGEIRIGTRSSELALRQAGMVQDALASRGRRSVLVTFTTTGDRDLNRPLAAIGAKGLFTKELEDALLDGRIDCAVHSLKDLPTESPPGLVIAARLARADPRDALVLAAGIAPASGDGLDAIPRGARVGTSSLRRRAQLLGSRPDVTVVELRGNVPTRLRRLDEGRADATILAAAGLVRLGLEARAHAMLDAPAWLPSPGQGAIAVQARDARGDIRDVLASIDDHATAIATRAERAFLASLDGGCQVPIGALAVAQPDGSLALHGWVSDQSGARVLRGHETVDPAHPEAAGESLARALDARGANAILAEVRAGAGGTRGDART